MQNISICAVIFSFEANSRSCDGEKLEIRRNQENAEILNTDSKAQVTRGYSGKYGTSNKHPCCININIYSGLGVTRENGENTELPHKWQP